MENYFQLQVTDSFQDQSAFQQSVILVHWPIKHFVAHLKPLFPKLLKYQGICISSSKLYVALWL